MKKLILKQRSDTPHWVGDGFPVRSIFNYNEIGQALSPFLLMDYIGPVEVKPNRDSHRLGVGDHPHRGFETVTLLYSGEVEHRDSSGGGGVIRAGDVQWMTAGSGLVHEELHGEELARNGGVFHGAQIWVNLPKKHKMAQPRYQGIESAKIPVVQLADNAGKVRVIAGEFGGAKGTAMTYSPVNMWDVSFNAGKTAEFKVPEGHTAAVFVADGTVELSDGTKLSEAEIGILERTGETFSLKAHGNAKVIFLGGEPIDEPIAGYGPFVMNSWDEISQAMKDYESGKMGSL